MTESEGRALTRTTMILLLAAAARWGMSARDGPPLLSPDSATSLPALLQESQNERDDAARRRAPLADGETIDPNQASEIDLDRLPGVGPAAARAIVAARELRLFGSPEDLLTVRGIGPATLERMRPHLGFPPGAAPPERLSSLAEVGAQPGLELNGASRQELEKLPGVGPALAGRILEERERRGGFGSVDDLLTVRGIGPATLERLRPHVSVR